MRSHISVGILVGTAIVLVAAGVAGLSLSAQQPTSPASSGSQTVQWVPLEYGYSITTPRGVLRYVEYRAGDGSTFRTNIDHDEVQILNIPRQSFYQRLNGTWTQSAMRPQPPPMQLPKDTTKFVPASDPRVQLIASAAGIPVTFLEWSTGPTFSTIYCPELNMLEVWSHRGEGEGLRVRQLTSLLMGEPAIAFVPPEDASIQRVVGEPRGPGVLSDTEAESLRSRVSR